MTKQLSYNIIKHKEIILIEMNSSIRQIYTVVNHIEDHGITGYHVDNKYFDAVKLKQQRILEASKDKPPAQRPNNVAKKPCFIDQIQKISAKLPGPTSYDPKQIIQKSKTESLNPAPHRKTIFDEMEYINKKYNIPGAGSYGKVHMQTDRTKLKSNIDKAQKANYVDSSMRGSLQSPGAGEYNSFHGQDHNCAVKWIQEKKQARQASQSVKLPPVGTYSPLPQSYSLFDNSSNKDKKLYKPNISREQRFKKSKEKPKPFYNISSEWGMKDKLRKKDILSHISYPSRSVYH